MRRYNIGGPQGAAALITLALWSALSVASAGDDLPIRFQARVLWIAAQTLLVDIMAVVAVRPAAVGKSQGPGHRGDARAGGRARVDQFSALCT
jgi:hypothetical protein